MALKDIVKRIKNVGGGNEGRIDLKKGIDFRPEGELNGVMVFLSRPGTLGEIEVRDGNGGKTRKIVHLSGRG